MKLAFSKYHGAGNDFILVDNRIGDIHLTSGKITRLCDRHLGIGADGLMFLTAEPGYDFGMRYYNSDGNESTMCGNGGRCITAFARSLNIIDQKAKLKAIDGEHTAEIINKIGKITSIRLKMSDLGKSKIQNPKSKIVHPKFLIPHSSFVINTGSPHLVIFTNDVHALDVVTEGRKLRYDPQFGPEGLNVDFVQIRENDSLFVRTYERGVENETLSCGTGVTAAAVAYSLMRDTGCGVRDTGYRINIDTSGGQLTVSFRQEGDRFTDIWLEGPAEFVFSGEL